jgi:hypothetical protein
MLVFPKDVGAIYIPSMDLRCSAQKGSTFLFEMSNAPLVVFCEPQSAPYSIFLIKC